MAQGYWMFTRHEQVREIYKHPELFSSESITPWEPDPAYRFIPTQIDPPTHIKYRQILNPWFSPGAVDRVTPTARAVCRRLIEELAPIGGCDFIADFALRYPTEVFLTMLGAPGADADLFVPWVDDFFKGFGGDPEGAAGMGDALAGIRNYWVEALAERRADAEPREGDLASHLLRSTIDDRPLTDDEMLDMLTVLVLAGLDTTRAQLGYLFRHLALTPDHRQQLVSDPSLIPSAVEESLRLHTIIFGDGRKVTEDVEFHGCPLKKGDMVYALVAGANRDPRVFDRADEFVLDRSGNQHFGFAGGPHRCLGAHLARREMQLATAEWLSVIPDFRIASDGPLIERGGGAMNALLALPLQWDPLGDR
jgi:cytochrome P450